MVKIGTWTKVHPDLAKKFVGAMGVVSCLGHRQPEWNNVRNKQVIAAMNARRSIGQ